jgi:uncharacterized protein YhdP
LLGLVVTAWSLLLIAWLTLHWGILPHIQQWREPIEQRASKALGVPVRIGQIDVRSRGWVPSFELREVVLLDPDQRPALRLPRISASVSPRSLLALAPRFEQLLIDGAELEVRRDVGGHIYVGGLNVSASHLDQDDASSAAADWFFAQGEFVIRGGALRWVDQQRAAAPLALADVQLVVRNGLRSHEIRIDATPPPEWGDRFTLTGQFTQPLLARNGDWRRWSGSGYVDLPRADLHELRQHVDMPFELNEARVRCAAGSISRTASRSRRRSTWRCVRSRCGWRPASIRSRSRRCRAGCWRSAAPRARSSRCSASHSSPATTSAGPKAT